MIDSIPMPRPHAFVTAPKIMTADAERLIGTGRLSAPYLQTVWETTWTYKTLVQEDYDALYDAYILSVARNKSIEHSLTTIDSNTGNLLSYTMYTQDDFIAHIYTMSNGKRQYTNVSFTFVGVGGGE